jgi:hypothetical protein
MRRVDHATLHAPVFFPGLGNMNKDMHQGSCPGIKMWLTDQGLECNYKGVDFFVPTPNIVAVRFEKLRPAVVANAGAAAVGE